MRLRFWDTNLKVKLVGDGIYFLLFWMYFPFITVYLSKELGSSLAGLLMTIPPIFSTFGSLIGGGLTDRFGRRSVMLLGSSLEAVMFLFFAVSPSPWVNYLAFIGIGLGGAIFRPASSAMVADLVPADQLREVFATFSTVNNIGSVLGPALGAIFFFHYRQELLWTCTVVQFMYVLAMFCLLDETRVKIRESAKVSTITHVFKEQWKGYGVIFHDKVFCVYIVAGIVALIPIMQLDLYLPVYITKHIPAQPLFAWKGVSIILSNTEIYGWLVGFTGLLFVLFILPVTKWMRHCRERDVFILSSLMAGFGLFCVGLNSNIWYLLFVTIIFTIGEMIRTPVTQSFISRYAQVHARGQYMGANSLQNTLGKFLAPLLVFLSNWIQPMGIFSLILFLSLISIGLYILLYRIYNEHQSAIN